MEGVKVYDIDSLKGYVLIDVREKHEFVKGHIPGALNIPGSSFAIPDVSRSKPLLVYCHTGPRAVRIGCMLESEGFEVYVLEGGYKAWKGFNGP